MCHEGREKPTAFTRATLPSVYVDQGLASTVGLFFMLWDEYSHFLMDTHE